MSSNDVVSELTAKVAMLEARVAQLERQETLSFIPLRSAKGSANWNGTSAISAGDHALELKTEFSIPALTKAVLMKASIRDSVAGSYGIIGPTSGATATICRVQVSNTFQDETFVVPCHTDGTLNFFASAELDSVVLTIWGYWL